MLSRGAEGPRTALAVWGDPIAHSRSPQLHRAAYAVLGLPWTYDRAQVDAVSFDTRLDALDGSWRGLSCTMPLKEAAFRRAQQRDRPAELTRAVNTLAFTEAGIIGANTDVAGIVRAFSTAGVASVRAARILGSGRTAASALVALSELGADVVEIRARRPEAAEPLVRLGEVLGIRVGAGALTASGPAPVDATVSTLPGGAVLPDGSAQQLAVTGGVLLDAAYDPWPSPLALRWEAAGNTAVSGLEMLLHQALLQVRIFVDPIDRAPLPGEPAVLEAMRASL